MKSILIRGIPKVNIFSATGAKGVREFFLESLRVFVKRSVPKINIIGLGRRVGR